MSFYIYPKTATDKCIILNARQPLCREMSIPASWRILDLVVGLSYTSTSSDNSAAVNETVVRQSLLDAFCFGVKDGAAIAPGSVGTKFVGFSTGIPEQATQQSYGGGYTRIYSGSYKSPVATATTDATISTSGVYGDRTDTFFTTAEHPEAATGYFRWIAIRLDRTTAGTLVASCNAPVGNQTDASDAALKASLAPATYEYRSSVAVPGVEEWALRHFYFRVPFFNQRARVHNYGFRLID